MPCLLLGGAHAGVEERDGRWFVFASIQYDTIFEVEVSRRDAEWVIRNAAIIDRLYPRAAK